jgi:type I restriction enzyme S subunit
VSTVSTEDRVLQWIGGLPDRWETAALGTRLKENKSSNKGMVEKQVLSLSYGRVVIKPEEKLRGLVPESFETYQILEPRDIVIRPTDLQNDQTSLRIGQSYFRGIITSAYIAVRPQNGMNYRYAAYMLSAYDFMKVFYGFGSGLRQNLDFKHIKHIPIPVPAADEQELIVRYLDHAEMRIAKAIAGKSNLVALLVERKAAIEAELLLGTQISADSTTWFGELPDGWTRLPARALCDERNDRDRDDLSLLSVTIRRGVVSQQDYFSSAGSKKDQSRSDKSQYKAVQPGDVVYNKMRAWQGAAGCSALEGIVSPAYVVVRPRELVVPEFLGRVMRTPQFAKEAERWSYGINSDMWSLRPHHFKLIEFAVPPLDVQHKLVAQVLDRTSELEEAITAIENEIALLKEYRVRLISDVVTGKLDVRAEAANLPDVDPLELAAVLAGGTATADEEEGADGDD